MTAATLDRPAPHLEAGRRPYAYNRRSKFRVKDLDVEVTRAVHRQAADAETACRDRGWGPPVHITEDGKSASRFATKSRDGWAEMLDAIRARRVSYVLVWLLDRATRQVGELVELLAACRETGTLILQTGTGTTINADDPDSVAMATISGALAEAEVAKMSKRIRRAHAEKARLGQFHGGRRRFGWNADMSALDPVESVIVERIAADLIRGRSLHSIARELTANGTPPPMWKGVPFAMGEWTGSNLGTMMRRPHLAGKYSRADGTVIGDGTWPPILDVETWQTLQAVLSAPSRRTAPEGTARKYLLSGIITCGVCGKPLRMRAANGPSKPAAYACPDNHVHRAITAVDGVVSGAIVKTLARPDFAAVWLAEPESDRGTLEARIEDIETELEAWVDRQMSGRATQRQVDRATANGMAEIARINGLLGTMAAARAVPAVLDGIGGNPDAAAVWDAMADDLDRRRAIVKAMCTPVLYPAERKGARFDPLTVHVVWRLGGE